MSKSLCIYPFVNLNSNTEGSIKLCCAIPENIHITKNGKEINFENTSIEDIWYSEYMTDIRKKMLAGERPEACNTCWKLEDMGIHSSRQSGWDEFKIIDDEFVKNIDFSENPELPASLELRLGNFCNLRCNSCWALSSDRIADERERMIKNDPDIPEWLVDSWRYELDMSKESNWLWWESEEFERTIDELAPKLKRLYLTGGEPTLIQKNIEIMQKILDSGNDRCYIALTTNLTKFNEVFYNTMSRFIHGEVQISIDDIRDRNHYIRYPTQWDHIEENLPKLYYTLPTNWKIKHYTVYQTFNYDTIPELIDWIDLHRSYHEKEKYRHYIWSPILLDNTSYLDARIIQKPYREEALVKLRDKLYNGVETHGTWWKHGVAQVIKFLENDHYTEEECVKLRKKFREFCDTMDRNRKSSCWYETFTEQLAQKVFSESNP